jgi:hypothetical protein
MDGPNLSGSWQGHYRQFGRKFPIGAELRQDGTRLTGNMWDEVTRVSHSLADELETLEGSRLGRDTIGMVLAAPFAGAGASDVRSDTELPRDSSLEGEVQGRVVSFVKTYLGPQHKTVQHGALQVAEVTRSSILYAGEVDAGGRIIAGTWTVRPASWVQRAILRLFGLRQRGEFVLQRLEYR